VQSKASPNVTENVNPIVVVETLKLSLEVDVELEKFFFLYVVIGIIAAIALSSILRRPSNLQKQPDHREKR
tara:strand:+ start:1199 stop:1411 length:213 start_codon:yes stop_codon:yes gene_type:complete